MSKPFVIFLIPLAVVATPILALWLPYSIKTAIITERYRSVNLPPELSFESKTNAGDLVDSGARVDYSYVSSTISPKSCLDIKASLEAQGYSLLTQSKHWDQFNATNPKTHLSLTVICAGNNVDIEVNIL